LFVDDNPAEPTLQFLTNLHRPQSIILDSHLVGNHFARLHAIKLLQLQLVNVLVVAGALVFASTSLLVLVDAIESHFAWLIWT